MYQYELQLFKLKVIHYLCQNIQMNCQINMHVLWKLYENIADYIFVIINFTFIYTRYWHIIHIILQGRIFKNYILICFIIIINIGNYVETITTIHMLYNAWETWYRYITVCMHVHMHNKIKLNEGNLCGNIVQNMINFLINLYSLQVFEWFLFLCFFWFTCKTKRRREVPVL